MRKSASHSPKNFLKARAIQNIREIYALVLEFFVIAKLRSQSFWLHFLQGRIKPLHIHFFVMQRSTIDCKWPNKVLRCARLMSSLVGVCTDTDAARWLCVRLALAFAGAAIVDEHGQAEAGPLALLIPMLSASDYGELVVVLSWVVEAALLAVVTHACVRIDVDANWVVRPLAKLSSVVIGLRLYAQWKKKWKEYGSEAIAREIKQAKTFEKTFEQSNWRLVLRPTLCCQKRTGERQHERNEGRNRKRTDKL